MLKPGTKVEVLSNNTNNPMFRGVITRIRLSPTEPGKVCYDVEGYWLTVGGRVKGQRTANAWLEGTYFRVAGASLPVKG